MKILAYSCALSITLMLSSIHAPRLRAQWTPHTLDPIGLRGADGVEPGVIHGLPAIATAYEEGSAIRVAFPGVGSVTVAVAFAGEDAVIGELTSVIDGEHVTHTVVAYACEGGPNGRRVGYSVAPENAEDVLSGVAWNNVVLPASVGLELYMKLALCDMDSDGDTDIAFVSKKETKGGVTFAGHVGWFENQGGSFARRVLADAGWGMSLYADDMNGDGVVDLIYTDRGKNDLTKRGAHLFLSAGGTHVKQTLGATNRNCLFADYVDVDGDGLKDLVCSQTGSNAIETFYRPENIGDPWPSVRRAFPSAVNSTVGTQLKSVRWLSGTKYVTTHEGASGTRAGVAIIDTAAWTVANIDGSAADKSDGCFLADMDGDGDLDIVTCYELPSPGGVFWYEQPNP